MYPSAYLPAGLESARSTGALDAVGDAHPRGWRNRDSNEYFVGPDEYADPDEHANRPNEYTDQYLRWSDEHADEHLACANQYPDPDEHAFRCWLLDALGFHDGLQRWRAS
jgi:hypothetical protein